MTTCTLPRDLTGCLPAAWQDRFSVTPRTGGEPQDLPYCPD